MENAKFSVFSFFLQLIVCYLFVVLFLLVMLVMVGHAPVSILFSVHGLLLQAILVAYFWIILFLVNTKQAHKRKTK
jgi:hypothetical protein